MSGSTASAAAFGVALRRLYRCYPLTPRAWNVIPPRDGIRWHSAPLFASGCLTFSEMSFGASCGHLGKTAGSLQ